jgi:uncharacterized protein (TIGR03643 family)
LRLVISDASGSESFDHSVRCRCSQRGALIDYRKYGALAFRIAINDRVGQKVSPSSRNHGILIKAMNETKLSEAEVSAIIEMALSDHVSFANIEREYSLSDSQVKELMRDSLKPSSYRTWRKRVRQFSDRRENYK